MTKILKGSTCQPEEIYEAQPTERLQQFRTREFWSKPPLERSRIAAEWLKKRMEHFHVTPEQVAMYTRMALPRLQTILDGSVVMGLGEFCDIFHSIPEADESHIPADNLYHHRMYGMLKKITWFKDGWNGEGSKGLPERLVRRFQHHIRFVPDVHLKDWQLSVTNEGKLMMTRGTDALLLSWDEIHPIKEAHDIHMSFTKENFAGVMELYSLNRRK